MKRNSVRSSRKQRGAATIEYALIVAAVIAISSAALTSGGDHSLYDKLMTRLDTIGTQLTGSE